MCKTSIGILTILRVYVYRLKYQNTEEIENKKSTTVTRIFTQTPTQTHYSNSVWILWICNQNKISLTTKTKSQTQAIKKPKKEEAERNKRLTLDPVKPG